MIKCKYCGNEIVGQFCVKNFCSNYCYEHWLLENKKPNCRCFICEKEFYLKPYRINRNKHGVTCSIKCNKELKSLIMSGENNHQYGLLGDLNASFKNIETVDSHGYLYQYVPNHPLSNKNNRVRKHRIIVENHYSLFKEEYFFKVGEKYYLKSKYDVHHVNENIKDNRIENLMILTRGEHTSLHNKKKTIIRNEKGKIIGVIKSRELLENLEEDNQQPSIIVI